MNWFTRLFAFDPVKRSSLSAMPLRSCGICHHVGVEVGAFLDLVSCEKCGAMYYTKVLEPIAVVTMKDGE